MIDRDWKCLECFVRDRADDVGLRDWEIIVDREPPIQPSNGDNVLAECDAIDGQRRAFLRFSEKFRDESPQQQVRVILHELLHCHFRAHVNLVWRLDETGLLAKAQWYPIWEAYKWSYEYCVDAIACAWAPSFPLIKWSSKRSHGRSHKRSTR